MKTIEYEIKNSLYRDRSKFRRKNIAGKDVYERIYTDSLDKEINSAEGVKLIDCLVEESNTDEYVENIDLKIAINKLNTYQRKILKMLYFDEKTQRETAKILSVHEKTISREKKKILNLLRETLTA
ncbi:sigma-70 family RNA polymerase sigma factor [Clostridium perfringens]|nr:sigma-70 family RNA polymerase sigma factor [Clostridium perfringens]WEV05043.1 sigma-70 family RNA polymerase sigma factor [Clostridium perfringens B]